jgi:hypothetical protein
MPDDAKCLKCGAPLTLDARDGVCPKCLLEQALAGDGARPTPGARTPACPADRASSTAASDAPTGAACQVACAPQEGDRIGRYKLLHKIGEGGCGIVFMAEQEEPERRRVALKVIKLGMDTKEVIARFEAERQALALMDHPNIAKVFDGGATDTGRPYFVMELVRGVRITEFRDQTRLSPRQRLELFMQVCQSVQHAHQKGIIHRDLKPSNVLVTVNDGVPVPKVIDFGIAKATGMRLTDKTLFTRFLHLLGTRAGSPVFSQSRRAGQCRSATLFGQPLRSHALVPKRWPTSWSSQPWRQCAGNPKRRFMTRRTRTTRECSNCSWRQPGTGTKSRNAGASWTRLSAELGTWPSRLARIEQPDKCRPCKKTERNMIPLELNIVFLALPDFVPARVASAGSACMALSSRLAGSRANPL